MGPIISILNLKNGVGTSALAWNIAHILELDIYQHDKAMHHLFSDKRIENKGIVQSKSISVNSIDKREFKSGVYDLGADINYGYVRQILSRSKVIVIPVEAGAEVLIKTIATIQYVAQHNEDCDIYVVFNKLDNSDPIRERNYTNYGKDRIAELDKAIVDRIKFYYIRYAFAMFRKLDEGYCLLDNFLSPDAQKVEISNFELLQHLRYSTLNNKSVSERQNVKTKLEQEKSDFHKDHKPFYEEFESYVDVSSFFNSKFIRNNTKILKDMLILTTYIKGFYSRTWEGK